MESINAQLAALVDDAVLDDGVAAVRPAIAARPTVAEAVRRALPGQVVAARERGKPVAVAVLADGRAYAVPDRCPHDGGLLSDGFVDGDRLVCARHGWEIEPCTGRCLQRPRELVATRELTRR